jgi:kynurenine formamidase
LQENKNHTKIFQQFYITEEPMSEKIPTLAFQPPTLFRACGSSNFADPPSDLLLASPSSTAPSFDLCPLATFPGPAFPYRIMDCTYPLHPDIPSWEGGCGFHQTTEVQYDGGSQFCLQNIAMRSGMGTHLDAPAHCIPGGMTADNIVPDQWISPCVVIDVSEMAHAAYQVSTEDILDFEGKYGPISEGTFVMVHTGWGRFWPNSTAYRNDLRFPTVGLRAAQFLLARNISGIGVDTLSPDGPDTGFPVHHAILGAGKYIVENVAHMEKIPPIGTWIAVVPMHVRGSCEVPVRLFTMVPKGDLV